MTTTTIPRFAGEYAIELDNDLYCAMHGTYSMYKGNGKVAEFKTLAGAVKFLAGQNIFPVIEAETATEPAVEEVATETVATEDVNAVPAILAITKFTDKRYTAGAPLGNTNASHDGPHRVAGRPSVSGDRLISLIAKLTVELGHEPNVHEIKAKINELALQAIDAYCQQNYLT